MIGLDLGEAETETFWREFLRGLRARGLTGVRLCVSDCHEGLQAAIGQVLGCPWQPLQRALPAQHAWSLRHESAADDLGRHPRFYVLPREHWPKLRSTSPLERVIGRRTDVVGIFSTKPP